MWSLYGEPLTVTENNEHLGLVVSGIEEEIKNVDENIISARKSLFSPQGISLHISVEPHLQLSFTSGGCL